jgi:hypothetical protein
MRHRKRHSAEASTTCGAGSVLDKQSLDSVEAATPHADEFGRWFATQSARLPLDFELDL